AVPTCPNGHTSSYAHAIKNLSPVIISDLEQAPFETGFEQYLRAQGFRSLMLAPLGYEGEVIGLLELASPERGVPNTLNALRLGEARTRTGSARRRRLAEGGSRLQAGIQQPYPAGRSTVEWRFREAADRFLQQQAEGRRPKPESVVLRDVYPLYGLTNVRDS